MARARKLGIFYSIPAKRSSTDSCFSGFTVHPSFPLPKGTGMTGERLPREQDLVAEDWTFLDAIVSSRRNIRDDSSHRACRQ